MSRIIVLDSGPLGEIINPNRSSDVTEWLSFITQSEIPIVVVEIIDYELRRQLQLEVLCGKDSFRKSINNLNKYRQREQFIPLDSCIDLDKACDIWAELRCNNQPTADLKNIDVDVILAAQAVSLKDEFSEVIIVTQNASDICRFNYLGLKVWDWKQALVDCKYNEINFYIR